MHPRAPRKRPLPGTEGALLSSPSLFFHHTNISLSDPRHSSTPLTSYCVFSCNLPFCPTLPQPDMPNPFTSAVAELRLCPASLPSVLLNAWANPNVLSSQTRLLAPRLYPSSCSWGVFPRQACRCVTARGAFQFSPRGQIRIQRGSTNSHPHAAHENTHYPATSWEQWPKGYNPNAKPPC